MLRLYNWIFIPVNNTSPLVRQLPLFIDGKAIVDNDGSHNARIAKGKVALDAGFHELRVL